VIPIYGRGGNEDPRAKTKDIVEVDVPSRPAGQRPAPVMRNPLLQPNTAAMGPAQQGLGIFPTLFGLQGQGGYAEPLTPEQQHQAFLSRLLLMLGSFVIMCRKY
jgi:E3 ubiquitin-protein ligase RNF5